MSFHHQNWDVTILQTSKSKPTHQNPAHSGFTKKLEADLRAPATDEAPPLAKLAILTPDMRQALINARTSLKMDRDALGKRACVPKQVVIALETGKPIQEKSMLQKINNVLHTKLKFP